VDGGTPLARLSAGAQGERLMMHRMRTRLAILGTVLATGVLVGCGGDSLVAPTSPTAATTTTTPPNPSSPPPASCLPGTPSNLQVVVVSGNRTFTWNAVANATSYFILIGTESGRSDVLETNTTQTTYQWNGASRGTYFARVYARNTCGSSPNSNEVAFN
jgi:hypothetical protein